VIIKSKLVPLSMGSPLTTTVGLSFALLLPLAMARTIRHADFHGSGPLPTSSTEV
jgi:hypothetical protein